MVVLLVVLVTAKSDPFLNILLFVRDGIYITIFITISAFVLILVLGLVGALGRLSRNPILYGISTLYVELVRGIPLLVQLVWWYFAFPVVYSILDAG